MKIKSLTYRLLAALALVAGTPVFAQSQSSQHLVIFGDSLSDPGNFYVAFHLSTVAPYQWIPGAPYAIGAMHFSNGATWIEQLARRLKVPTDAASALQSPDLSRNYAVGGARARAGAIGFPYFDLGTQVSLFAAAAHGQAAPDALYVIEIGGNDERDALADLSVGDVAGAGAAIEEGVTSTANNIKALWSMGARRFLVITAPDLSLTPYVNSLGAPALGAAGLIASLYNGGLNQAVDALRALPGVNIRELDSNAVIESAMAAPHGELENFVTPCLRFNTPVHAVCEEAEEHFFWDGIHPTTAGHALLAQAAWQLLATGN
jgi:phospholipase/lecithinase/hemolysin